MLWAVPQTPHRKAQDRMVLMLSARGGLQILPAGHSGLPRGPFLLLPRSTEGLFKKYPASSELSWEEFTLSMSEYTDVF